MFISPDLGVGRINCAHEVAFYEAGANLASTPMLAALDRFAPGITETASGARLNAEGQPNLSPQRANVSLRLGSIRQTNRFQLASRLPEVWQRMTRRKACLTDVPKIRLPEEVILLSNTAGYLRPYLLDKRRALVRQ